MTREAAAVGEAINDSHAALPGIKRLAMDVLGMPVRTAQPEKLLGLADRLNSPAYSTSVGLLTWAAALQALPFSTREGPKKGRKLTKGDGENWNTVKDLIKRLLP